MNNSTEIRTAEVTDRTLLNNEGTFMARVSDIPDSDQTVYYVSPYGSAAKAGMIAVPEVGTPILVCKPTDSNQWYYMGSTFAPEIITLDDEVDGGKSAAFGQSGKITGPFSRVDKDIGKVSNVPNKILLKGNHGHGLEISDERNGVDTVAIKTELTSSNGKKITMHDSPGIDSIKIDSGNNASITLTQNPQDNPQKGAASIEVDCNGPQLHVSRESDLEMKVLGGGRELNMVNSANGVPWGSFQHSNPVNPCGNVNVQSDWGDVNILSKSPLTGRIFIETVNPAGVTQLIQLATNGANGTIVLKSNRILLDALETIELAAPGGVYINGGAGGVHTTTAGPVETLAGAGINLEPGAGVVNLAGGATPIPGPNIPARTRVPNPENTGDYAFRGVE